MKLRFLKTLISAYTKKGWKELCFDDSEYQYALEKADTDYSFAEEAVPCADVYSINPLLARADMRCNCNYNETCTLSGETDEFEFFDYKAFRYVNVFTDIDNIEPESFKAIVSHYKFEQKHFLTSPIPMLNNIWDMCVRTIRYSAQESIYDCPTREKGVYLGDFTVAGLAQLYLTDDPEQYKRILFDFAETTKVCKGMMAIASCSMMQELADYSLLYPMQVLKALAKIGAYDEVLALLINESEHSWVNMLREGATTCFEAWGKEQKWNTSLCHPWATAPIVIITEDLDGKFGIEVEKR